MRYYIALDFDGTLCANDFPEIGKFNETVFIQLGEKLLNLRRNGYEPVCILWTCREDIPGERQYLTEAVEWCKKHKLPIKYINENPEFAVGPKDKVRKIFANEYWDDRAYNPITLQKKGTVPLYQTHKIGRKEQ